MMLILFFVNLIKFRILDQTTSPCTYVDGSDGVFDFLKKKEMFVDKYKELK